MDELNKKQAMGLRRADRGSSMAMAMAIPEIITNIFSFLDRSSLPAYIQVSRLWYACGRRLSWQSRSVTTSQLTILQKQGHLDERMQEFCKNSRYIQCLVITEPRSMLELPESLAPQSSTMSGHWSKVDFRNLTHLALKTESLRVGILRTKSLCNHVGTVLVHCPGIQDLEWDAHDLVVTRLLVNSVLRYTTKSLKRLSISGTFKRFEIEILHHLIQTHMAYRQQQPEQKDIPIVSPNSMNGDHDGGCSQLEELILRNQGSGAFGMNPDLNLTALYEVPGVLPIRSLSLVDFRTDSYYYRSRGLIPPAEENDSILAVLEKCPDLEKLHITLDFSKVLADTCHDSFQNALAKQSDYNPDSSTFKLKDAQAGFVQFMAGSCPKLRDIELGMVPQLTRNHWNEMMDAYGQQLDSFSVWGDHGRFDTSAFMKLIGLPLTHPSRDQPHCLTRLNINGHNRLGGCAWVALRQLPHLKEFKARDVPLEAKQLVMKDGWICKGLEVLEIFITINRQQEPNDVVWHWCDHRDRWSTDGLLCCEEIRASDDKHKLIEAINTILDEGEDKDEFKDRRTGFNSSGNESGAATKMKGGADQHLRELQIKVCEMLGLFTRLRVLRIEGERTMKRDCLELTLETGLDHLAPLQQNLEKLVVTRLNEGLAGRKEVEWIARNWIHHRNRRWLERHASTSQFSWPSSHMDQESMGSQDVIVPNPKLRELTGITVTSDGYGISEAMKNMEWLRTQCPTLKAHVV
ncbi:hypothetical protein B0O80DRAFT_502677 [Mortierella sp. GBAus27b]|nr:hypothetical protein BGX31_011240 [Mortierella sp. GBA43]KAI8347564.1 hypothetical protein B0O80DRAFT_502677 [Mortierella sp. GBAus27b]